MKNNIIINAPQKTEILCAIASMLWGAWIINPFYDSFAHISTYSAMAKIAPEELWGSVVLILGIAKLVLNFLETKFDYKRTKFKSSLYLISVFIWLTIATSFIIGAPESAAVSMAIFYAILNVICFFDINARVIRYKILENSGIKRNGKQY